MTKIMITTSAVKVILFIESIVLFWLVGYALLGNGSTFELQVLFVVLPIVIMLHMYFGYKWAKYLAVAFTLSFVVVQLITVNFRFFNNVYLFMIGLLCVALVTNTVVMLRSVSVKQFLLNQITQRSRSMVLVLKATRWLLFVVIGVSLFKDLARLFV